MRRASARLENQHLQRALYQLATLSLIILWEEYAEAGRISTESWLAIEPLTTTTVRSSACGFSAANVDTASVDVGDQGGRRLQFVASNHFL